MFDRNRLMTTALLFAAMTFATACSKNKPAPRSTTTSETKTSTETDTGDKTRVDTKQVTTEEKDGSVNVKTTETTNTDAPPKK